MFFRFAPESEHRASMCPLGAVRALRGAALRDSALARTGLAHPICGAVFDRTSEIVQPPRTRAAGNPGGGDHQASKRGIIGEGEHGCAQLDTAGNSPMHT